ncbi:hypothetical protein VNO77_34450 [Canavalia gladiata]|uniref:Uncharacterized protein n=1 Tax=Canavalia gladiata TaxID=3824 RepID=A0AAN9KGJ9_CANGL
MVMTNLWSQILKDDALQVALMQRFLQTDSLDLLDPLLDLELRSSRKRRKFSRKLGKFQEQELLVFFGEAKEAQEHNMIVEIEARGKGFSSILQRCWSKIQWLVRKVYRQKFPDNFRSCVDLWMRYIAGLDENLIGES